MNTDTDTNGQSSSNDSPSRMITQLREGGVEEFSRQFMRLRPRIRTLVASRLHGRLLSRLDASDVVQETFIRACKMLNNYLATPSVHPSIWLSTISKQIMAEMVRKQFRRKRSPQLECATTPTEKLEEVFFDEQDSVGTNLEREELSSRINFLLTKLPVTDREIIEMRHAEAYSFGEIGDMLEINVHAAKKRYYRALKRLRAAAAKDSYFEELGSQSLLSQLS